ncbi:transposase [Pontibacter korlensis]|uniref:transposase n=1 Tax=Pontibacter korlensis TaxID=400092 RepID=UPI0008FFBE46
MLAISLLVYTQGFARMEDGRKLACYCGWHPSSTEAARRVMGRTGVSWFANKESKQVLCMAALSSTRNNREMRPTSSARSVKARAI